MLPTLSSYSFDEMFEAGREQGLKNMATRTPASPFSGETTQWMQLYVNRDRALTKKIVQKAEGMGVKALFITVDAPQLGMGFSFLLKVCTFYNYFLYHFSSCVCFCMRMFICMICMYIFVCVYVCMYIFVYVRMHVCMHVCMFVCMYVCMHACMHVCIDICMYDFYVCLYVSIYVCIYLFMYACVYASVRVCYERAYVWSAYARPSRKRHAQQVYQGFPRRAEKECGVKQPIGRGSALDFAIHRSIS